MKRKILSLLLALCLVVGMVPLAASAENGDTTVITIADKTGTYSTLQEAYNAAEDGDTLIFSAGTFDTTLGNPADRNSQTIQKAINLRGSSEGETIFEGYLKIAGYSTSSEKDGSEEEQVPITISNITFKPKEGESNNFGLYFGNGWNTTAKMNYWVLNVLDCKFENWQYAVCLQGGKGSETGGCDTSNNTLSIRGNQFDNVFCAVSIAEGAGYLGSDSEIDPAVFAVQIFGSNMNCYYTSAALTAEPIKGVQLNGSWEAYVTTDEGGRKYDSLKNLIESATEATEINLATDVDLDSPIILETEDDITINGNGKTITFAGVDPCKTVFTAPAGSEVEGIPTGVTLNVNNVNFVGQGTNAGYAAIIGGNSYNTNVAFANCGFENLYCAVIANYQTKPENEENEYPSISITKSNFKDTTYGYSIDETTPGAAVDQVKPTFTDNTVGAGELVEAEPWFEVETKDGKVTKYNSFTSAFNAASEGDTIVLADDVTLTDKLTITKGITIDGAGHSISYEGEKAIQTGAFIEISGKGDDVTLENLTVNTNGEAKHGIQFYCVEGGKLDNVTVNGGFYTSVIVNGSKVEITSSVMNPDGGAYANIEYAMGSNVKEIPEITLSGVTGDTNKPLVYADKTTATNLKNSDDDIEENATQKEIADAINDKYLKGAEITLYYPAEPGEEPSIIPGTEIYTISFNANDGILGDSTITALTQNDGKVSVIPANPSRTGYTFTGWYTAASGGTKIDLESYTFAANTTLYAHWTKNSTPVYPSNPGGDDKPEEPEEPAFPFTDVKSPAWYYNAVKYVYENNLMAGTGDTTFDPEVSLTRAMTAQILYNLEGQPKVDEEATFSDMTEAPTWSVDAIAWAQDTGVVAGMGDNEFAPNAKVTREQFAQMMYNYAKYKKYDLTKTGDLSKFPDDGSVSDWAETAMSWANGNGLINGHEDSGLIDPAGNTIRGQAASIIMNFDKNVVK